MRSEASEQMEVASRLRMAGVLFAYIPNDGEDMGKKSTRNKKLQMGLLPGCPDILIFSAPAPYRGIALEMKRSDRTMSALSENQVKVLGQLEDLGWAKVVAFGAEDALTKLRALGLEVDPKPRKSLTQKLLGR